jgi:class 3 adenylate cyclase
MPWIKATALARIHKLKGEVPSFDVQRFEDYWPLYEARRAILASRKERASPPLFSLPKGKAVVVDTVQIYIAIANYDEFRLDQGRETEASHERAMRLLHLYYSAADRAIETSRAQRVDFHNGRVHAVVLERGKQGVTSDTLAEAFAFIDDFKRVAEVANRELARSEFGAAFRIGVDVGTCVAINNGTGCEQEPMFLGSAANHAAKLAFGKESGVYVSDRVRKLLGRQEVGVINRFLSLSDNDVAVHAARRDAGDRLVYGVQDRRDYARNLVENWRDELRKSELPDFTLPSFSFSYRQPPLCEIDFAELQPSRSIRMPLMSLYADLSGYTDYIDRAVASGGIRDAVAALYVIRQEFQNVVEQDFGGRKVRFIGDCIHALIAEGSRTETDARGSVSSAAQCAGGLHSSFQLCRQVLGNLESLGLAIGLELGPTPISRIGIRGDRSVRVASSVATTRSEQLQRDCLENGVKLGPKALRACPAALEDLLDASGYSANFDYGEVAVCLSVTPSSAASPVYARAHAPGKLAAVRAHLKAE